MGHREDLLMGAKRCLIEKGYGRTTTRDIVAASGTNLASIGYHYGSKEALLAQAYGELVAETSDAFEGPDSGGVTADPGSLERFRQVWAHIIGTMREPNTASRSRPDSMRTKAMVVDISLFPPSTAKPPQASIGGTGSGGHAVVRCGT